MNLAKLGIRGRRNVSHQPKGLPDGRCPKKWCRTPLEFSTDGNGTSIAICLPCDRTIQGLCRGCPSKITGKKRWCPKCLKQNDLDRHNRAYRNNPEHHRAKRRRWHRNACQDPVKRALLLEKMRQWHRENPESPNDFARRYKRAWSKAYYGKPINREKRNAYRRKYRLEHPELRARELDRMRQRYQRVKEKAVLYARRRRAELKARKFRQLKAA